MQKRFCGLFVVLLLAASFTHAQSRKKARDSSVVIIFNESSATRSGTVKKGSTEKNIIKISPLGFLSGQFPLLYERSINDFFSVQVGGGLTHRNYVRDAIAKADEQDPKYSSYPWPSNGISYNDEAESIYSFDRRKAKLGYMFTVQPRVYFGSDGLEGGFLGLSFDYLRYNFESPKAVLASSSSSSNLSFTGPMQQEYENIKDFMANFGGQSLSDRISFEYTVGLGLRNISGSKYAAAVGSNSSGTTRTLYDGQAQYSDTRLNFGIGLKVGYHF